MTFFWVLLIILGLGWFVYTRVKRGQGDIFPSIPQREIEKYLPRLPRERFEESLRIRDNVRHIENRFFSSEIDIKEVIRVLKKIWVFVSLVPAVFLIGVYLLLSSDTHPLVLKYLAIFLGWIIARRLGISRVLTVLILFILFALIFISSR